MTPLLPEYSLLIVLGAGVTGITLLQASPVWYINFLLLLLLSGVLFLTRTWPDRGFYLACSGEPLVVACSITNLWAGLFVVCMVAGMVCLASRLLESRKDIGVFALFCGGSFLIALVIQWSNHVLPALLVFSTISAVILFVLSVRTYQFRNYYSGA